MPTETRPAQPSPSPEPDVSAAPKTRSRTEGQRWIAGLCVTLVLTLVAVVGIWGPRSGGVQELILSQLESLRQAQSSSPVAVFAGAFILYVAVTGLSLPGAAVMTLAYGWMFGFFQGLLLVSFASSAGASLAFLMSRYLLRETIQNRFGHWLESFNAALKSEGAFYLFTLRLIPAVPFFIINVVMGLTPISLGTFWWVSQLGMIPGTAVYVYAGTSLPGLEQLRNPSVTKILSPQILLALALLGLFPLIMRWIMKWIDPRLKKSVDSSGHKDH